MVNRCELAPASVALQPNAAFVRIDVESETLDLISDTPNVKRVRRVPVGPNGVAADSNDSDSARAMIARVHVYFHHEISSKSGSDLAER